MNTNEDIAYYLESYRAALRFLKPGHPPSEPMQRVRKEALRLLRALNPGVSNNEILAFARQITHSN
jgi:hypothetical protein|tara:strand:- start:2600 stop:2797 length:198 start_codon:yes stop_codon:yes gene_type:complete